MFCVGWQCSDGILCGGSDTNGVVVVVVVVVAAALHCADVRVGKSESRKKSLRQLFLYYYISRNQPHRASGEPTGWWRWGSLGNLLLGLCLLMSVPAVSSLGKTEPGCGD